MPKPPVVFLVGFMGSGKSTLAGPLAARLGVAAADLDAVIVERTGRSIADLFAAEGEEAFRRIEREALFGLEPAFATGLVVATGGGTAVDAGHREFMRRHGTVVWLDAPVDVLRGRLPDDGTRPLRGDAEAFEALHAARKRHYDAAHLRVSTAAEAPEALAERIARALAGS